MATKDNARRWTADTFLPKPTNPASSLHASNALNGAGTGAHSNLDVIREMDDKEHPDHPFLDPLNGHQLMDSCSGSSSSSSGGGSGSNNSSSDENDEEIEEDEDAGSDDDTEHGHEDDADEALGSGNEHHGPTQEGDSCTKKSLSASSSSASGNVSAVASSADCSRRPNRRESISGSGGAGTARKFTKKVKKVKTKSSKASKATSDEAKLEAAKPVVDRFLELENPDLNGKPVFLFMIPGSGDVAMTGIEVQDPIAEFMQHAEACRRKRDYADMEIIKKSYMSMRFLTRNDVYHEFLISQFHIELVKALFDVFKPESDGNFYHFQKVMEMILRKYRVNTLDSLFATSDPVTGKPTKPLIMEMLPYLDQPPVASVMIQILFPAGTLSLSLVTKRMVDYYQVLRQERFTEKLMALVTLLKEPSPGFSEFLLAILDEANRHRDAKALLTDLADEPMWAERLVDGACSNLAARQRGCIELLYSILVRSIQVPFQDMYTSNFFITDSTFGRVEAHLESIANGYATYLVPHVPKLCELFIGTKDFGQEIVLPGYKVERSFTVARLWLLDCIYHCLGNASEDPTILESIPAQFWACLVHSFIQFRFNNAYHVLFYKFFRLALWSDNKSVYERFFLDPNLVHQLIEHYRLGEREPTGSKGYIILILNCLRLSADVEQLPLRERKRLRRTRTGASPRMAGRHSSYGEGNDNINDGVNDVVMKNSGSEGDEEQEGPVEEDDDENEEESSSHSQFRPTKFWTHYLGGHPDWQGFKTTLREATLIQTKDTTYDMDRSLRLQFAPVQSRSPNEAPLVKKHFGIPGIAAIGQDGIDLGSQYSNTLGFGVPMVYEPPKVEAPREDTFTRATKGLSEAMNSMEWRLIPPQRVVNAMKKAGLADSSNANGGGSRNGVILLPPPSSVAIDGDDTASAAGKTCGKEDDSSPSEASPIVGSADEDASGKASATKTSKKNKSKKKKNKKKNRQPPSASEQFTIAAASEPEDRGSTAVGGDARAETDDVQASSTSGPQVLFPSSSSNASNSAVKSPKKKAVSGQGTTRDEAMKDDIAYYQNILEYKTETVIDQKHRQELQGQENTRQGALDSNRTRPSGSSLSSTAPVEEPDDQAKDEEQTKLDRRREKRKRKRVAQQQRKKLVNLQTNATNGTSSTP
ncbi:hypothetical protein BGZ73_008150 [Actinomortierella ambigua]|nr:hypothetical protein BGZ73_008150 [Actinomortierella ambigua]